MCSCLLLLNADLGIIMVPAADFLCVCVCVIITVMNIVSAFTLFWK